MKNICLLVLLLVGAVSMNAQKVTEGSFDVLANEKTVNVRIDYSDSRIDKLPFEIFLESEDKWEEGYREILTKFIKSANQNSKDIIFSSQKETDYRLVFKAEIVDRDGDTSGYLLLLNKDKNIIGKAEKFNANGGHFGSQTNLMGDAAERLGKKIASFIKNQIKVSKNK